MTETKTPRMGYLRTLAERVEEAGGQLIHAWRSRARRRDPVGDVSYRGLEVVHGGLELTVRSLSRLERATQPPHRAARHEPHPQAGETEAGPAARPTAHPAQAHRRPHPERTRPATTTS
jgi:hypothetical protein